MVEVNVLVKSIETDPTGTMITLTVDATTEGETEEVCMSEMLGNLRGKTDVEVRQHFKGIFLDVLRQEAGAKEEVDTEKVWKRAQAFIGTTYTIDIDAIPEPEPRTIDDIPYATFLRDTDDETKIWKVIIKSGAVEILESSLDEVFG